MQGTELRPKSLRRLLRSAISCDNAPFSLTTALYIILPMSKGMFHGLGPYWTHCSSIATGQQHTVYSRTVGPRLTPTYSKAMAGTSGKSYKRRGAFLSGVLPSSSVTPHPVKN